MSIKHHTRKYNRKKFISILVRYWNVCLNYVNWSLKLIFSSWHVATHDRFFQPQTERVIYLLLTFAAKDVGNFNNRVSRLFWFCLTPNSSKSTTNSYVSISYTSSSILIPGKFSVVVYQYVFKIIKVAVKANGFNSSLMPLAFSMDVLFLYLISFQGPLRLQPNRAIQQTLWKDWTVEEFYLFGSSLLILAKICRKLPSEEGDPMEIK